MSWDQQARDEFEDMIFSAITDALEKNMSFLRIWPLRGDQVLLGLARPFPHQPPRLPLVSEHFPEDL